jgi:phosphoribosylamine--glycine ligase
MVKVLIVGSGGREHTLAWKLRQSPLVSELFIAPGNGGTAAEGTNVPISDTDVPALVKFATDNAIGLVVAGPEAPLVLGLADALAAANVPCFGPDAFAANLEGSKSFAKTVMREAGVPTADFAVFTDLAAAKAHVATRPLPMVVKADGLAAGKGVVVARTRAEALDALDEMMVQRIFGPAGDKVVVEDALIGEEASFLAFCDGKHASPMPSAQDHKPVGEGDTGPNTGGMGAYSPAPVLPPADWEKTADLCIRPILKRLAELGHPFKGILYAGLMYTAAGPLVLEYNVRFGDPECQPLLCRLDSDLCAVMLACIAGDLPKADVRWSNDTAICVVMAAAGYPKAYPKGMAISGIPAAEALGRVKVFHAGTKAADGGAVTSGGRVLGVTALGPDLASAQALAYRAVDLVRFANSYVRRDIGGKGIGR